MRPSPAVRDAMLDFYARISASDVGSFDRLVSTDPATLVTGTAPGEWVTERERLRFGFEAEGLAIAPGSAPAGFEHGQVGWFADEPTYAFPGGATMRTRLTSVLQLEDGDWRIVRMHVSIGVPDEEVVETPDPLGKRMTDALDYGQFDALTFDCYGTLIDWERGILTSLRPSLAALASQPADDELLEAFGRAEAAIEAGPYRRYRDVLAGCLEAICDEHGVAPSPEALAAFGGSVADWPAFPDSAAALARLKTRFKLGVITNCDDDLFAASNRRLGVELDWVVTAESVGSYKPDPHNFEVAFDRIGLPRDRVLHVAQSLFHDHVPAKRLGMSTVWIDRRQGRAGSGATPPADASPDATFPDMASFAERATRWPGSGG